MIKKSYISHTVKFKNLNNLLSGISFYERNELICSNFIILVVHSKNKYLFCYFYFVHNYKVIFLVFSLFFTFPDFFLISSCFSRFFTILYTILHTFLYTRFTSEAFYLSRVKYSGAGLFFLLKPPLFRAFHFFKVETLGTGFLFPMATYFPRVKCSSAGLLSYTSSSHLRLFGSIPSIRSSLCLPSRVLLHKRFMGGKPPIGHINKILDSLPKSQPLINSTPPVPPTTLNPNTVSPKKNIDVISSVNKPPSSSTPFISSSKQPDLILSSKSTSSQSDLINKKPSLTPVETKFKDAIIYENKKKEIEKEKEKPKFITYSGKGYEGGNIKIGLSTENLIKESKIREVLKDDENSKVVNIKLVDDSIINMSSSDMGVKVTPLGASYDTIVYEPELYTLSPENFDEEPILDIVVVNNSCEDQIKYGYKKHMILVCIDKLDNYFAMGYFTSKKDAELFYDIKIKSFQEKLEEEENAKKEHKEEDSLKINKEEKKPALLSKQQIVYSSRFRLLNKGEFKRIKWGREYISKIDETTKENLEERFDNMRKNTNYEIFKGQAFTRKNLEDICIYYDKVASSKGKLKHPLSEQLAEKSKNEKDKNSSKDKNKKPNE